jgi:hypothetical protein
VFRNGRRFATGLWEVAFHGLLAHERAPYVVLTGRGCTECDADISLYILSPLAPPSTEMGRRYWAPGVVRDFATHKVIRRSRGFVGRCLTAPWDAVLTFDSLVDAAGKWHAGLFIGRIIGDSIADSLQVPPPPISQTLARVRTGTCHEIRGVAQNSEP